MVVQGHVFTISVVIMDLPGKEAYPLLLGRPWLRSARMKHDWQKNVLIFQREGCKIRIHTTMGGTPARSLAPLHAESVNMLKGLTKEEAIAYFSENPTIVPLYELDIVKEVELYHIVAA
jgi:hypothetical protein